MSRHSLLLYSWLRLRKRRRLVKALRNGDPLFILKCEKVESIVFFPPIFESGVFFPPIFYSFSCEGFARDRARRAHHASFPMTRRCSLLFASSRYPILLLLILGHLHIVEAVHIAKAKTTVLEHVETLSLWMLIFLHLLKAESSAAAP